MKITTLVLLAASLALPAQAGSPADRENEIKRMREKESNRAREVAEDFADKDEFTEKYTQLKESEPGLFATALEKRLLAAKAWQTAAEGFTKINSYEDITAVKAPAQDAEEVAEIARMELRAAGSESEWKRATEKYKSREFEAIAAQLSQNQRNIIQTTKQRMMTQKQLRQLEIERNALNAKMRETQDKAREDEQRKQDKDSSRDRDKDKDRDKGRDDEKDRPQHNPGKVLVE